MKYTSQTKKGDTKKPQSRVLDPSRSGGDLIGDTTGLTGITTGSAAGTSATPDDTKKDENKNHLPGGVMIGKGNRSTVGKIPETAINDEAYNKDVLKGISQTQADAAEDIASEDESPSSDVRAKSPSVSNEEIEKDAVGVSIQNASGDDSPGSADVNTETAPYQQPYNTGSQSVNGSESDPTADDDTQANTFGMGEQLGEDEKQENPQEIGLADDIDKAQRHMQTH